MPISTNEINYLAFNPERWNQLTLDITKGDYVLIIGGDMILKESSCNHSSAVYFETLRNRRKSEDSEFSDLGRREQMLRIIEEQDFKIDDVSDKLVELLSTKCFRMVMTTTFDHYVETVMRKIWGDDLVVLDIYGDSATGFDLDKNIISDEFYETKPTLYYVYGNADPKDRNKKFTITENDHLEVLSRWINVESRPNRLCEFLSRKQILAIGCKFENWYFRFFWYALRGNIQLPMRGRRKSVSGNVAMTLDLNDSSSSDAQLGRYLKQEGVYTYPDSEEFVNELVTKLYNLKENVDRIRALGGVFISYAHEDTSIATIIFNHLASRGINVWMDSTHLFGGDLYDSRIEAAISGCKLFLPILSSQTMNDILQGNTERYYFKEWKLAKGKGILSVELGSYNIHSESHIRVEEWLGRRTSHNFSQHTISTLSDRIIDLLENNEL